MKQIILIHHNNNYFYHRVEGSGAMVVERITLQRAKDIVDANPEARRIGSIIEGRNWEMSLFIEDEVMEVMA